MDEENWDKLEFNECEDDEFRCTNGMCISEEFWLDGEYYTFPKAFSILNIILGDYDCMDWSDELFQSNEQSCVFESNEMACDERACQQDYYSCGDGQCIPWVTRMAFQRLYPTADDCFNKRNLNYMCEVSPHRFTWTSESGLCWPDEGHDDNRYPSWSKIQSSNLTKNQICEYLFRCILSNNFERDCPCGHINCINQMKKVCPLQGLILYPSEGLINPNVFVYYEYTKSRGNQHFYDLMLSGSIKC
jgi:hypothetical protein